MTSNVNLITLTFFRTGHNGVTESGEPEKMSVSTSQSSHSQAGGSANGKGYGQAGDGDLGVFNLRDTLSAISVREANFAEFLAALKQSGLQPVK